VKAPLEGVRVIEIAHFVAVPAAGALLADLGAEVIKVEPLEGDNTRRLQAAGAFAFGLPALEAWLARVLE